MPLSIPESTIDKVDEERIGEIPTNSGLIGYVFARLDYGNEYTKLLEVDEHHGT